MAETQFSLRIPNRPKAVRRALVEICGRTDASGSGPDTVGRIEITLAEVLNNVVEHALRHEEEGEIHLTATRKNDGWHFDIRDGGVAMPGGIVPHPDLPGNNCPLENLPEGGFGWAIVNTLARDLHYRRRAGGNHLTFVIPEH
ncbi:MAG: ATP-binding protein [Rhodobacteraceae bacterium]|nr:ATP-binding protein [Paracoccaceae bacterium]MCW9043345.1 ATP-binding protein [Pseudopelagicola sp.]